MAETIATELAQELGDAPYEHEDQATAAMREAQLSFLRAAELGDIYDVARVMRAHADLNIDCVDALGRTALRLAVRQRHIDVVRLLLERSGVINVYESLLLSIGLDHDVISDVIIRHAKYAAYKEQYGAGGLAQPADHHVDDTLFSLDVTPLMLAAQRNNFQIVKLLQMQGESIEEPHDFWCRCSACHDTALALDTLRLARARLHAYRGLVSPAYITLYCQDPILTSFTLNRKLVVIADMEKHFKAEYLQLASDLGTFQIRLLDRVRNSGELNSLLDNPAGAPIATYDRLARFKLALHLRQKRFVSHAYCQRKLMSLWSGHLKQMVSSRMRWLQMLALALAYPFIAIVCIFCPAAKCHRFLNVPVVKFTASVVSYMVFIAMVLEFTLDESPSTGYKLSEHPDIGPIFMDYVNSSSVDANDMLRRDRMVRRVGLTPTAVILMIWIAGFVWQDAREVYDFGYKYYTDSWFNLLDFSYQTLYIASFTLRYLASFKVSIALEYFKNPKAWLHLDDRRDEALYQAYWIEADRYYWVSYDPYVLSEALFSVANIIACWRMVGFLIASERIGPLIISLARMIVDVAKFMLILVAVLFAFIVGFHNLYWYYEPASRSQVELTDHGIATGHLGSTDSIIEYCFWSLFGLTELETIEIGPYPYRDLTEGVAYILVAVYNLATIIVLVNMLIAMMSRSFDIIAEDQDTEWKFSRSKMYMDFIKDGSTLPVPLNLLPSIGCIGKYCCSCCFGKRKGSKDNNSSEDHNETSGHNNGATRVGSKGVTSTETITLQAIDADDGTGQNGRHVRSKPAGGDAGRQDSVVVGALWKGSSDNLDLRQSTDDLNDDKKEDFDEQEYDRVVKKILRRYLIHLHAGTGDEATGEDGSGVASGEDLRKEVTTLRFEMQSQMRRYERQHDDLKSQVEGVKKNISDVNRTCEKILESLGNLGERSPYTRPLHVPSPSPQRSPSPRRREKISTVNKPEPRNIPLERSSSLSPECQQLLDEMGFPDLNLGDLDRRAGSSVLLPVGGSMFDQPRVRRVTRTTTERDGVRTVTTTTQGHDGRTHVDKTQSRV